MPSPTEPSRADAVLTRGRWVPVTADSRGVGTRAETNWNRASMPSYFGGGSVGGVKVQFETVANWIFPPRQADVTSGSRTHPGRAGGGLATWRRRTDGLQHALPRAGSQRS